MKTVKIKSTSIDQGGCVIINESDFDPSIHELADGETLSDAHKATVQLTTELSPELQKTIDDTKAEIAKVVAENTELKAQVAELNKKLRFKELEDQGSDALKAALDEAEIKYKANDSKSVLAQLLLDHELKPKE